MFEHILEPASFLKMIAACLSDNDRVVIEVPSLMDPLLVLYDSDAYGKFYFQSQHPYIYGPASLIRVLEHNGCEVVETIAQQRYGFDNHLNWLMTGKPGGSQKLREVFAGLDDDYRSTVIDNGYSDTFFVIART